jgi:hypothetical protein
MSRWIRFLIVLGIGFGIGLAYGWLIDPVEYVDTQPQSLRDDYKTDYVLMVAEAYHAERDSSLARERLLFLGKASPVSIIEEAMFYAVQSGYATADLGLLRDLSDALGAGTTPEGESQP